MYTLVEDFNLNLLHATHKIFTLKSWTKVLIETWARLYFKFEAFEGLTNLTR